MRVHLESIYGFYHGQDPRTFDPDEECCTKKELDNHKLAVDLAHQGKWKPDDSGCQISENKIVCKSSFGIGVYSYVADDQGEFVRSANYDDTLMGNPYWEESK